MRIGGTTGQAAAPVINANGGTFIGSASLALSTTTTGASIRYTTDGSTPTATSALYSAPIVLTANATVKAIAMKAGMSNSAVSSAVFAINKPTVAIAATDAMASEPGTDGGQFTVTRNGNMYAAMSVTLTVSGTATTGTDYNALPVTVTIPVGTLTAAVAVVPKDDTAVEGAETVVATVAANAAYTVGSSSSATVTVNDNDTAPPPPPLPPPANSQYLEAEGALLTAPMGLLRAQAAFGADPLPETRRIDWSKAGVPGGIPNRTTIYATLNPGATAAQINQAIQNCPADQVVFLNAGTYTLSASINFNGKSRVTLRGAGPGNTILKPGHSGPLIDSGQTAWFGTVRSITAGNTKGSTSITVNDVSGIQAGMMLNIFQDADPSFYWTRDPGYRQDHTGQFAMVKAVSGNTLQLEDPLVWGFNRNPRLKPEMQPGMRWTGIENLTMTAGSSYSGEFIQFWTTYACWIKNVETSWGNGNSHIQWWSCLRGEVRDSYIHDTFSSNDGYGFLTVAGWSGDRAGCTGTLVENNIFSGLRTPVLIETEVGSVIAYNYCRNTRFTGWPNYQIADISDHAAHNLMNLIEGNVGTGVQVSDGYHGSSSHYTLFRNWFSGQHVEATRTGNVKTVDLCRFTRYSNVVGNVLGFPGWPRTTTGRYEMTGEPGYTEQTCIYRLGYPNPGNNGYSTTNPPSHGEDGGLDPLTKTTLFRWGNFDYQNNTARWESSEVGGVPVPPDHSLPASLYLATKPAWWGSLAWPPIGPDCTPLAGKIPAQLRYEAMTNPAPTITTHPANTSVIAGQTATFSVVANGAAPLSYQWQKNGVNISGATGASYTTPAATLPDNGATFRGVVSNSVGTATSNAATLTVTSPPPPLPTVSVSATDASAGEPSNPGTFTITRTGSTAPALTVNFSVSGTATGGTDYAALGTSVTIAAGAASATKTVSPVDDLLPESSETVIVAIAANAAYTVGSPASATVTIADNDNTAPAIVSAASATPNPALVGQNVSFSIAASDENGDTLAYGWTFGDGTSGTGSSVTHAYAGVGTFTAKATVNDGRGGSVISSVTITVSSASGIVVDNKNANTSRAGTWAVSAGLKPWAAQSLFSNGGGTFRWIPDVPAAGGYQVYAWWTYHSNRSTNVPYKISHAAGTATVNVNQRLSASGGKWNLLGTFSFNAGSVGFVEVSSINGQACADAIRLVPVTVAEAFEAEEIAAGAAVAPSAAPGDLTVDAMKLSVNFAKETGAVRLKATLALAADANPAGAAVAVDIGGATASFTLDKRGRGKGANGTLAMKRSKSGWLLTASLKNLVWQNQWTEAGVEDWKTYQGALNMPISMTVGDETFTGADLLRVVPGAKGTAGK